MILEYARIKPMDEDQKKTRGGAREGSGRKPGSGEGRKKGVFVSLNDQQMDWVKSQPEGPPGYLRRLSDEDQAKREKPQA